MADDSGILSIDFLAGFTIFLLAFIWVASMVPGLFIGLQSNTIDYDAVAYRTGVILAEDPGSPAGLPKDNISWENLPDTNKVDLKRFGLVVSRESPGILDPSKVDRFFCTTVFSYPEDYRTRAIFGDFPYQFNISFSEAGNGRFRSVGGTVPESHGYIRRPVKIKSFSNATIDADKIRAFRFYNNENVSSHQFSIQINNSKLLHGEIMDPEYQINSLNDRIIINITGLNTSPVRSEDPLIMPAQANLTEITYSKTYLGGTDLLGFTANSLDPYVYIDGVPITTHPFPEPRPIVKENISLIFKPSFFQRASTTDIITVTLKFGLDSPQPYLNSTRTGPFDYNYNPANVTQPSLSDAVLEVAVW